VTDLSTPEWIQLALLLRPQGRRGELLAEPMTDLPEVFAAGRTVWLTPANAAAPASQTQPTTLENHWFPTGKNAARIVLKLSGCDSISEAESLAGKQLMVPAGEMPALDADTFFVGDLLGCSLYDGDALVGKVVDLHFATSPDGRTRLEDAAPLLAVELTGDNAPEDPEPILVPFVRAWLTSVDLAIKRITMHLPAGLFDTDIHNEQSPNDEPRLPTKP